MGADSASDEELLRRMLAGEEAALESLYRRRQGGLYRFALQMSGSRAVAEDVTQDAFLYLMRHGAKYDPARGTVAAFLLGVARNLVLRAARRREGGEPDEDAAGDGTGPLEETHRRELIDSVRAAVLALPVHYREVVVLCELEELDYAAAAAVLECAVGTVRSRLHRGRALLAERLRAAHGPVRPARCSI